MGASSPPQPLRKTIQTLTIINADGLHKSLRDIADLYVAALALFCHLKKDQATLQQFRQQQENACESKCPPPQKIPAMTAVHNDAALFRALLRCLHGGGDSDHHHHHHHHHSHHQPGSRKRSMSFQAEPPNNKAFKLTHSPVPAGRLKLGGAASGPSTDAIFRSAKTPTLSIPVMAATILFVAFEHVDHWPAPLVKAYADDCFGPRAWVDDPACQLLVQNLQLVHNDSSGASCDKETPDDPNRAADAKAVMEAYLDFEKTSAELEASGGDASVNGNQNVAQGVPTPLDSQQARRRGSLSSTGSFPSIQRQKSNSGVEDDFSVSSSRKSSENQIEMDDDSDSGDEVGEEMVVTSVQTASDSSKKFPESQRTKPPPKSDDGNSSSSGEEEDEEVAHLAAKTDVSLQSQGSQTKTDGTKSPIFRKGLYPLVQSRLNLVRVRQRYFGLNRDSACESVAQSLSDRLDVKSKQNSGLLQCLPSFTGIPVVRQLIAENLEKWLQSPALAGLARTLFSSTVNHMKNSDPPLEADLRAIDCILSMRLKANQLNAHIENITSIAKRIPTGAVALRMYSKLLPDIVREVDATDSKSADMLKMFSAVHQSIPEHISYESLAATLLTMLLSGKREGEGEAHRTATLKRLRYIIRMLATELHPGFDGCLLMEAILSFDVSGDVDDEEDKARLMFQCVTMHAAFASGTTHEGRKPRQAVRNGLAPSAIMHVRKCLAAARKTLLRWCCTDYGPRCGATTADGESSSGDDTEVGAGTPDYHSVLGPASDEEKIPSWLNTMRCLLFLEDADSPLMKKFFMSADEIEWEEELTRIRICCDHGSSLDDSMIWIIVKACGSRKHSLYPKVAIELIENLFECCSNGRSGTLEVSDPTIVWELFNLVQYSPSDPSSLRRPKEEDEDVMEEDLPRLAYPGLWWRVTVLTLVMCSKSTQKIGSIVWKENPTVRNLIKMIVSKRYRFPTVDCDDRAREEMKQSEQDARDKETKLAEYLFLPPEQKADDSAKKSGSRVSRRLLKQQKAKEVARRNKELSRRRKMLKMAQRSIMLWDPDGPARKPPREAAELLLSAEGLFGLSQTFQLSVDPDFLLLTLGGTGRAAIERAYDWLIPIVSRVPDTIGRLPSSASCFLLLRAYNADSDDRARLKELSAPLLAHVAGCLKGKYGKTESVKAFDLLMSDVASHKAERRRCARRVLYEALQKEEGSQSKSWMLRILDVDFAHELVADVIKYMSTAATFERGRALRSLIMALEKHLSFAETKSIAIDLRFPDLVAELVSTRPSVFADALDSFPDLRSLVCRVIHGEFLLHAKASGSADGDNGSFKHEDLVLLRRVGAVDGSSEMHLPLRVLSSISVLLSVWQDEVENDADTKHAVQELVDSILLSDTKREEENALGGGLASAVFLDSKLPAVSVESWIMLAKARSDVIARRAALSAPTGFLPRLLLCSGLPRASLVTMIDRLGCLGRSSEDKDSVYEPIISSSLGSETGLGRRRDVGRKLLGRLAAYTRINALDDGQSANSTDFFVWLSRKCTKKDERARKQRPQKKINKEKPPESLVSLKAVASIISGLAVEELSDKNTLPANEMDMISFLPITAEPTKVKEVGGNLSADFVIETFKSDDLCKFEVLMNRFLDNIAPRPAPKQHPIESEFYNDVCIRLIEAYSSLEHKDERRTLLILKWVPLLSQLKGNPKLWKAAFSQQNDAATTKMLDELISRCIGSWDPHHVDSCLDWLVSIHKDSVNLCLNRMVKFLHLTSRAPASHTDSFVDSSTTFANSTWYGSDERLEAFTSIATRQSASSASGDSHPGCIDISPATSLLLILAAGEKAQTRKVTDLILTELSKTSQSDSGGLLEALLRVYLSRPRWMDLGKVEVRSALVQAAEMYRQDWASFRCSFDDQIDNLLDATFGGDLRMARSLTDMARSHPLLFLRKLQDVISLLRRDATGGTTGSDKDSRLIHGQAVGDPREANMAGNLARVTIRHWGYSYSEPLWLAMLDVVAAIPKEVLFNCGLKLGFLDFLGVYLMLLSVQLQLLSADKAARLKTKLSECFAVFQRTSLSGWREWLGITVEGSEVRHLLMSCSFITAAEAIESLKAVPSG